MGHIIAVSLGILSAITCLHSVLSHRAWMDRRMMAIWIGIMAIFVELISKK